MKTEIDLGAITIDGGRLKAAREALGASIAEMASTVTLSREQIQHIEDGGNRPFYTPAHKLLAVRKYTTALGIHYDEVVTGPGAGQTIPAPDDAPTSMMTHGDVPEPADLRLAAVERNAEVRRLITMGAIVLCILLAVYAKVRGSQDDARNDEASVELAETSGQEEPARTNPVPAAISSATDTEAQAPVETRPAPEPRVTSEANATAAATTPRTDLPGKGETSKVATDNGQECEAKAGRDVKSWSPAYQRKADSRLFLVSPKGGTICVADATGKGRLVSLKPMVGQAISGKPPYVVSSVQLAQMEIYLQGLRVKIPAEADTMKLVTTTQQAPSESADSTSN